MGGRVAIHVDFTGYKPGELYPDSPLPFELQTRLNGATNRTSLVGENTPENPAADRPSVNAEGEATFQTRALTAGKHRISVHLPQLQPELHLLVHGRDPGDDRAGGLACREAPAIKRPRVAIDDREVTRAATTEAADADGALSDPSLAGTVQFFGQSNVPIGTPVPVVDGVATYTGTLRTSRSTCSPASSRPNDRDTGVAGLDGRAAACAVRRPRSSRSVPATATTTTLAVSGERVAR